MAIYISGHVEGDTQIARQFMGLETNLQNFHKPLDKSRKQLLKTTDANFGVSGALMGGWQPRTQIYSWPLLQRTGRMRGDFRSSVKVSRMEIWNPTPYFKYHQSNRPRRKLPRRVMLKIIAQDKRRIMKFFHEWLVDEVRESRRG
jgi:hypothetical protein|nr:MAG TPA: virion morphogenesis protein [Caudoviricetes sp.]